VATGEEMVTQRSAKSEMMEVLERIISSRKMVGMFVSSYRRRVVLFAGDESDLTEFRND
jgi:hypothetical protein